MQLSGEGEGPRYLHYIGVLPQFFATGGVVGHLALRPPRHRFDPRLSSPPGRQRKQRYHSRRREPRNISPHSAAFESGPPLLSTHPNFSGIISSFSSITLFLFPKPARRSAINRTARAASRESPCVYTKSPDAELHTTPGPYKFTGILKLL